MAKKKPAAAPKPAGLTEKFCSAPHCQGMVNGNGCNGYTDGAGEKKACPVSGHFPA